MLASALFAALSATAAYAGTPVESGNWVEDKPGYSTQQCAGGTVSGGDFKLPTSPNGSTSGSGCGNGHLRAERHYNDDYSSGTHQFGGQFKVNSMSGDRISLKQTFNGNTGPYFLMAIKSNGDLYSVQGGATIASGVAKVGATVRINTVHNADLKRFSVYVNGAEGFRDDDAPGGSFYDKLGAYTTNSGTGPIDVTWSDVQFWHRA